MLLTAEIEVVIADTREKERIGKKWEGILVFLILSHVGLKVKGDLLAVAFQKDCFFREPNRPRGKVMECCLRSLSE